MPTGEQLTRFRAYYVPLIYNIAKCTINFHTGYWGVVRSKGLINVTTPGKGKR